MDCELLASEAHPNSSKSTSTGVLGRGLSRCARGTNFRFSPFRSPTPRRLVSSRTAPAVFVFRRSQPTTLPCTATSPNQVDPGSPLLKPEGRQIEQLNVAQATLVSGSAHALSSNVACSCSAMNSSLMRQRQQSPSGNFGAGLETIGLSTLTSAPVVSRIWGPACEAVPYCRFPPPLLP